jgi:D-glycero-alpha-D-manno-heptose 1-phosphate guanylyltransferase
MRVEKIFQEAIILAGGLGTRLRSHIDGMPKVMAPINGLPFLHYCFKYLSLNNIEHVVLSVGYLSEQIVSYFGDNYEGIKITYSKEQTPLGTGGATLFALKHLTSRNPFFVINGDSFHNIDLRAMTKNHHANSADVTVSAVLAKENLRYGKISFDKNWQITNYNDVKADKDDYANSGVYLFSPKIKKIREGKGPICLDTDIVRELLLKNSSLFAYFSSDYFIDIGIPKDYESAQNTIPKLFS